MSAVLTPSTVSDPVTLDLQRLAGRLGAEVRGLRLSGALAPETFAP